MKPRLIILVVVLVIVGVVAAVSMKSRVNPPENGGETEIVGPTIDGPAGVKKTLDKMDLPGREPVEEPVFDVDVKVDQAEGQNRLYFHITEQHGYFVETLQLHFFFQPDDPGAEEIDLQAPLFVNKFLRANDTLVYYTQITPLEMEEIGGDMGTDDNWRAEVVSYNRARTEDPDPSWEGYKIEEQ